MPVRGYQASSAIRYGRKLQKRVIGRCERLRLRPNVEIGRVIFLTFPSPKVPISLVTINCFSITARENACSSSMDPLTRKIFRKILDCFAQWEKELEIRLKDRYSNGYVQICWRITFPLTLLIVGDRLAPYIWFHLIFLKHRVSSVSHGIIIRTRFRKIHFRSPLMHRIN